MLFMRKNKFVEFVRIFFLVFFQFICLALEEKEKGPAAFCIQRLVNDFEYNEEQKERETDRQTVCVRGRERKLVSEREIEWECEREKKKRGRYCVKESIR